MRIPQIVAAACLALTMLAGTASGASYTWTNQDITFDLEVTQTTGLVTAELVVDTALDPSTDYLHAVSVKIFSGEVAGGSMVGPTGWIYQAGASGPASVYPGLGTYPATSGFVSGLYSGLTGEDVTTGGPFTYTFSWATSLTPLATPSIKALTVDADGDRERQWSSGGLAPPSTGAPEPGTLALLGLGLAGLAGVVVRRRRAVA